jgi:hypothetical protein
VPPTSAHQLGDVKDKHLNLPPGDYVVSRLWTRSLQITRPGRVRIFVVDDKLSEGPCVWVTTNSSINNAFGRPSNGSLEIWYGGSGVIKLDHNSKFSGIIYAPNASVELGPNNVEFKGAIVARVIIADGNVSLGSDETLTNWHP